MQGGKALLFMIQAEGRELRKVGLAKVTVSELQIKDFTPDFLSSAGVDTVKSNVPHLHI